MRLWGALRWHPIKFNFRPLGVHVKDLVRTHTTAYLNPAVASPNACSVISLIVPEEMFFETITAKLNIRPDLMTPTFAKWIEGEVASTSGQ